MNIEMISVTDLLKDPNNARKHDAKNLEAIKGSLAKFGQQKPIVVTDKNIVLAGNGTLEAARDLGWDNIQVIRTELKGSDATAYALADNRSSELAAWDDEVLGKTLKALQDENFDLGAIGFDDISQWIKEPETIPGCDDDEIPEAVEPNTKPGDLYTLGDHRLLCGDSTNVQHVERLLNDVKIDMVFTDPPYGIALDVDRSEGGTRGFRNVLPGRKTNKYKPIENDSFDFDPSLILGLFGEAKEMFLWGAHNYARRLPEGSIGSWVVWDKKLSEAGDSTPVSDFEICWSRERHKMAMIRILWNGPFGHSKKDDGANRVHPTQKPTKLAEYFIERWGKNCKSVIDLFLGSGSTLIACEKTKRKCYGMEIDPHYCDVILERWRKYTGKEPQLDARAT